MELAIYATDRRLKLMKFEDFIYLTEMEADPMDVYKQHLLDLDYLA
jgi:hypothetical protein